MNFTSAKSKLKEKLMEQAKNPTSKTKYNEYFLSSKNSKKMLLEFKHAFEAELLQHPSHSTKQEFRQKFLRDTLLGHLSSKQYKRRKNAFYILNLLVQTDPHFAETVAKHFIKIKEILFSADNLPSLLNLEITTDFLKFKVFINTKVLQWVDKYSSKHPDLYIWKKSQSKFFTHSVPDGQASATLEKFEEKYEQLKIYRVIFDRNSAEFENLRTQFQTLRFESLEARKLMECQDNGQFISYHQLKNEEEKSTTNFDQKSKSPQENEGNENPHNIEYLFEIDMEEFVDKEDNILHSEDEASSSMKEAKKSLGVNPEGKGNQIDEGLKLNVEERIKAMNRFEGSEKNVTLFRVIQDNQKTIERRVIPLLEMFRVEVSYFRTLQASCITVVTEKFSLESNYKGKIKISMKQAEEFNKSYNEVEEQDILTLQGQIESLLRQALELKRDLEMIQLQDQKGYQAEQNFLLLDDEDDPDAKLFE